MPWRDRILSPGDSREEWLEARRGRIGASDAGKFARAASVEKYVRAKLTPGFNGNVATESGNRWEPVLLAWAGFEQNLALIHHPDEPGFAATPDGIDEAGGVLRLAEIKAKHRQILDGPKPHEVRQMAFQLFVVPEAVSVSYVWGELVPDPSEPDGWRLRRDPQTVVFHRDDPQIVAATELIVPIAHKVLAALTAAQQIESPF